jgi:hypothetical protein
MAQEFIPQSGINYFVTEKLISSGNEGRAAPLVKHKMLDHIP